MVMIGKGILLNRRVCLRDAVGEESSVCHIILAWSCQGTDGRNDLSMVIFLCDNGLELTLSVLMFNGGSGVCGLIVPSRFRYSRY